MKILIVEDEKVLNESMVTYLSGSGYTCESVSTYNDALEKIDHHTYDCIVLDIMLPGGSGLQLLKYLKEDRKDEGVIIISAKGALDEQMGGPIPEVCSFYMKSPPCEMDDLRAFELNIEKWAS